MSKPIPPLPSSSVHKTIGGSIDIDLFRSMTEGGFQFRCYLESDIHMIQTEWLREGMRRAAGIAEESMCSKEVEYEYAGNVTTLARNAILSASETVVP